MNINKNDYVVVNGKKYYADNGNTNVLKAGGTRKIDPSKIIKRMNHSPLYAGTQYLRRSGYTPSNDDKSKLSGDELFNSYPDIIKKEILARRINWANDIAEKYGENVFTDENGHRWVKADDGSDVDLDAFAKSTSDFDSENDQLVNGIMHKLYPQSIIPNYEKDAKGNVIIDSETNKPKIAKDQTRIKSGDNIFWHQLTAEMSNSRSNFVPNEWDFLKKVGLGEYYDNPNYVWSRYENPQDKSAIYNFYKPDEKGYSDHAITLIHDPSDGTWQQYRYKKGDGIHPTKEDVRDIDENTKDINEYLNERKENGHAPIMGGNSKGLIFLKNIATDKGWSGSEKQSYSLGGRTTRLYAVGGLTGEQIPIGEQPEDYNMVGAGGSHEQNPMGGVPYGVNQDGSQNMVEEGEVSVGNNVFSDRTAISPELCQQLGLPEGTSPAQAMQQIEALYEQGQIGDEEFQEIQQIIFEDQEAQKQNVGQSYQQGEVGGEGVPQEGITTDMMQGSSMPPEAMQGGMQPMPQQGAPMPQTEGITPDMVQGGMYGCGGRMRRW